MAWNGQVPIGPEGLLHYPDTYYRSKKDAWKWYDASPFSAELRFFCFRRGRSAAYAVWKGDDGREWPMFLRDLEDAIPSTDCGRLRGVFGFAKRGQNFGITLIEPASKEGDECRRK